MTTGTKKVNASVGGTAPLRNVTLCLQLITRLSERPAHLPGIGVFYGPSGFGKTTAAVHGAQRHNAYYVECGSSWHASSLVDAILHELTGHPSKGTVATKVERIIQLLAQDPKPLIIDEADHLVKKTMVDVVREISDKSAAPVVFIGEEQLPQKLIAFERAHNRVLEWVPAEPADINDAKSLAKIYVPELAIHDDLLKHIVETTDGITRRLVINFESIRQVALQKNLSKVGLSDWGDHDVYTGSPKPRARQLRRRAS
ncbi:AAA family ATPase [Aestuariivirga sp. YIM B02566]|uniref:AAA family ATPase n=1 Tax=Taklimakanibacter albus TaxID=2800327 RepID=A0ACC5R6M8_9HYPH|nr:AAA family ATPase [Aestuariivirga sp. YIM B02566]MBK1868287.1 AAA family ATPase [Aestuariivirga sp. YIM B02566]